MTGTEALPDLDRALAGAQRIVAGIQPGQWSDATPCSGLDVRAVLNHLITGNLVFTALVRAEPAPDRAADHLGDDPVAAFHAAGQALVQAFAAPGVLEATYSAPFGTAPGAVLVHVRTVEILGHGWDLARATGQRPDFPAGTVERTLALARQQLADRPAGPGAPFADAVPVPGDAPAIDRLAGFLGRRP
jgi:uncharacterized protein (TIGR03086 family)